MDLADIGFRVDTSGISRGSSALDDMDRRGSKATKSLTDGFGSLSTAIGGALAIYGSFSKLISVSREFDVLNAQLITATGSIDGASKAFEALSSFAATTPYSLDQAVKGFTQLVNLGLTPSERALKSYGNTAAAMGKDLSQMIEAVADASTGEFERLKEFGIKASKQGDDIRVTFQGVTTTIGNSAAEIEGYLMGLGENQFAGAMEERANTLDGAISNLEDTWDGLFRAVSSAGTGELIASGVRMATDEIQSLTDMIASGEMLGKIQAWGNQWVLATETSVASFKRMGEENTAEIDGIRYATGEAVDFIITAFMQMPANVTAAIQIATVEVASFADKVKAYAVKMDYYLNPMNFINGADMSSVDAAYEESVRNIEKARLAATTSFLEARDKVIASYKSEIKQADDLRAKYDEEKKDRASSTDDALAGYGKIAAAREKDTSLSKSAAKEAGKAAKAAEREKAQAAKDAAKETAKAWDEAWKSYQDGIKQQGKEFDDLISRVDDFGGAWSRSGSVMVDTFGDMAAALEDYSSKMETIGKLQEELTFQRLQYADGTAEAAKLDAGLAKMQDEAAKTQLGAIAGIMGASSKMFKEQSKERKMLHALEMGFSAAEIAIAAEKAIANAAAAITNQGNGDPYTAFGRIAAMIGIMAGVLGAAGIAFSSGGGGSYTPPTAGTGTTLGDESAQSGSISAAQDEFQDIALDQLAELRGIRTSIEQLGSGIERLAVSLVRGGIDGGFDTSGLGTVNTGVMADLGSSLDKLPLADELLNGIISGFSSTTKKLVDYGIMMGEQTFEQMADIDGIVVDMYQTIKVTKKKWWGLSSKTKTKDKLTEADAEISDQFAQIFGFIGDSVLNAASSLGFGDLQEQLNQIVLNVGKVSFKDKTGDEIQKELEAMFGQQADIITETLIPDMKNWQQIGEGLYETLMRVAKEQAVFSDAIAMIGIDLSELSNVMQIDIGQSIIDMMGGLDEFTSATSEYFSKFYTESEQLDSLTKSLTEAMESMGLGMVDTRDEFRKLVESLDLTTESGQATFAGLMELAPAFDEYISALDKQQKAEQAAIEAKKKAEQAALKAQQEANDAIVKAMEETASEAEKLMEELEDAARSAYSALERSVEMEKQAAQARLDVAREAYDAETQRIDAMRSQLEAARSELQAGVDESIKALDKALAAEISTINESATAQISAINDVRDQHISAIKSALSEQISAITLDRDNQISAIEAARDSQIANINAARDAEVSAITAARDARLDALGEEKSALQTMVSELTSLADRYRQVAEPDVTGSGKGLIEALEAAKAGNFELAKELQVGAVSSAGFGSQSDMAIAAAIQAGRMQQISDLAQIEADRASSRLSDVEMQIEAEKAIAAEQVAAVKAAADRQIKILTDQYNAALGIDTTVLSFAEAMKGYQEATKALDELAYEDQMSKFDMLQASADDVYKLHEEAYNQEISRLDEILADGESRLNAMLGIDDSVKSVDESVIELGNAISASTAQRSETEALRQELAKLREDMAAANQSIAKSTATTAAVLQRIEIDGMDTRVIA